MCICEDTHTQVLGGVGTPLLVRCVHIRAGDDTQRACSFSRVARDMQWPADVMIASSQPIGTMGMSAAHAVTDWAGRERGGEEGGHRRLMLSSCATMRRHC